MSNTIPVFRKWVPEWLIRTIIFMVVVPSMCLFGLSTANPAAAMGHYGIEPPDVQYSMVIFYAAVASFFALERRFFIFIATREYVVISTAIQVITSYICYTTHYIPVLFVFRFIQGMANCSSTSICITLIFSRLHSERSREIGYSLFYGVLLCITPLSALVTTPVTDAFDYNVLYKFIIFLYTPGAALLFLIMNNVRLNRKFPLYQVDWASFVIYAVIMCLMGYILLYGQQYYWLADKRIAFSTLAAALLMALHILRQKKLKRPYLSLEVFRYRNFVIGGLLIFVLYICRGALGVSTGYFGSVLGMDPTHVAWMQLPNMAGIIIGALVSSRMVIQKRPMRLVWIYGFGLLLIFHVWMCFLFNTQADAESFMVPMVVQGLGAGMLMTPLILFMVSSVPTELSSTASATGVFFRFTGFCSSIAFINYFQLYAQRTHHSRFLQQLTDLNPLYTQKLQDYKQGLMSHGMAADNAAKASKGLLYKAVAAQAQLRYAMDYYQLVSYMLLAVLLLIALYPYINKTVVNVKANQPAPAAY